MDSRNQTQEIPKRIRILQITLWIALLRGMKSGKLYRVTDEEDQGCYCLSCPNFLQCKIWRRNCVDPFPVSAALSPPTVENLTSTGSFAVSFKEFERQRLRANLALVTSKQPCAPAPLAWTTLSGILSRSNDSIYQLNESHSSTL